MLFSKPNSTKSGSPKIKYINEVANRPNDLSWYDRLKSLFDFSTLVSFFNRLGEPLDLAEDTDKNPTVPGIMALNMVTTPGYSKSISDPASLSAIQLYEGVRCKLNKALTQYGPGDLGILMFCFSDILASYMNILRVFGIMDTWDMNNTYLPWGLIKAAYADDYRTFYNDVASNGANYRFRFNQVVNNAVNFVYCPEDYTLAKRHSWLFANIWKDSDEPKAQLYIHRKAGYYIWDETGMTGSKATFYPYGNDWTLGDYIDSFERQCEAVRNSTSVQVMISDLRQAYQDANFYQMAYVDERYDLAITKSDEVLMQIENLECLDFNWENAYALDVTHAPGTDDHIIYTPSFTGYGEVYGTRWGVKKLFNIHWESPSQGDVMIASRDKVVVKYDADGEALHVTSCGADFCTNIEVITKSDTGDVTSMGYQQMINFDGLADLDSKEEVILSAYGISFINYLATTFDWSPTLYYMSLNAPGTLGGIYPVCDYANYTTTDDEQIRKLHLTALLSMWNIPDFGPKK